MKSAFANAAFFLCGALAAPGGPESAFVFKRLDQKAGVAIIQPVVAPEIGVALDSGPAVIAVGEVLRCEAETRTHDAVVDGQNATVSEQLLRCGDRVLVVKGILFAKGNG